MIMSGTGGMFSGFRLDAWASALRIMGATLDSSAPIVSEPDVIFAKTR